MTSREDRTDRLLAALVALAGVVVLAQSWRRWLDPIIDTGRDLYVPVALLNGAKLYRDIRYQYPPLTPYVLAGITGVAGHSLGVYAAIGIAQSIAIAALLWFIARRVGGRWSAFAASLMFAAINFTGASTFGANFVFPYSYAATFGMLLLLAFVAAAVAERPRLAIAFALAASWCKLEYFVAAAAGIAALIVVRKMRARDGAMFAALIGVTAAIAVGYFDIGPLRENIFAESLIQGGPAKLFFSRVSGSASWRDIALEALLGIATIVVIEALLWRNHRKAAIAAVAVAAIALPSAALFRGFGVLQWGTLFRRRDPWLFVLGALSIAATLRIVFNVAPVWYGFALVVPLYLVIARYVRSELVWVALLLALSIRSIKEERVRFALKRFPIETARGVLLDHNPDRAAVLNEALPQLRGRSLAVFPEGVSLNYFAGAPATLTYHTFTPAETSDPRVEDDVIREMTQRPPDQVVILTRDVQEFGSRGFGVDYDQRLLALVRARYAVVQSWSRPRFELVLLRRR